MYTLKHIKKTIKTVPAAKLATAYKFAKECKPKIKTRAFNEAFYLITGRSLQHRNYAGVQNNRPKFEKTFLLEIFNTATEEETHHILMELEKELTPKQSEQLQEEIQRTIYILKTKTQHINSEPEKLFNVLQSSGNKDKILKSSLLEISTGNEGKELKLILNLNLEELLKRSEVLRAGKI